MAEGCAPRVVGGCSGSSAAMMCVREAVLGGSAVGARQWPWLLCGWQDPTLCLRRVHVRDWIIGTPNLGFAYLVL
jgi:hypothetical protein